MRELSISESDTVGGAGAVGDFVEAIAGAICGKITRGLGGGIVCAAGAVLLGDAVEGAKDYRPTDPMDVKLGINQGARS